MCVRASTCTWTALTERFLRARFHGRRLRVYIYICAHTYARWNAHTIQGWYLAVFVVCAYSAPPNTIPTHVSRMHHARKQLWMRQPMVSVGANEGGREGKTVWREGFYYYTVRGYNRGNAQIIPKAAKQAAVITPRTR